MKYKESLSKLYPALIVGMGVLICFLLIITKPVAEAEEIKRAAPIVDIELITPKSMNITIKSQGTVIPRTESKLFPEITGEVVYVSPKLDKGSSFNKGDVLLKIDSRDYELDIKTAEANLDDANAALFVAQAESNFERVKKFMDSNDKGTSFEDIYRCLQWAASMGREVAGGRNFSVVHDKWGTERLESELKRDNDMYKLRRYQNNWK